LHLGRPPRGSVHSPFARSRQGAPQRRLSLVSTFLVLIGAVLAVGGIFFAVQDLFAAWLPVLR
jgi:hypothetical protein